MRGAMKMFRGVLVLGRIAAADVAANQAQAKVHPTVAHLHAFGANVCLGGGSLHLIHMTAFGSHFMILSTRGVRVPSDPSFPDPPRLHSWFEGIPSACSWEIPRDGCHRT